MGTAEQLDPLFTAIDAPDGFTEAHIAALASGAAAAIRVPRFLDAGQCGSIMAYLPDLGVGSYNPRRVPTPITRFGPALNDYRGPDGTLDELRYWAEAERARRQWASAAFRPDPLAIAFARLGAAWGTAVTAATIRGRAVFGGTTREVNDGTLIHYDDVIREYPHGVFDQKVVAQLAFNVWAVGPAKGGETTIWRRRWQPGDEAHRHHYGYASAVTASCQSVTIAPRSGDALLFNPANLHAVSPCDQGQRRVAFACFLAITTTGGLIAWS